MVILDIRYQHTCKTSREWAGGMIFVWAIYWLISQETNIQTNQEQQQQQKKEKWIM